MKPETSPWRFWLRLTVYDVLGKSLLDKVADVTNTAKQLASGVMAGNIPISNKDGKIDFNDDVIPEAEYDMVGHLAYSIFQLHQYLSPSKICEAFFL